MEGAPALWKWLWSSVESIVGFGKGRVVGGGCHEVSKYWQALSEKGICWFGGVGAERGTVSATEALRQLWIRG